MGISSALVVSLIISPLLRIVGEVKIGTVSRKVCLVSLDVILFLVRIILFEKI